MSSAYWGRMVSGEDGFSTQITVAHCLGVTGGGGHIFALIARDGVINFIHFGYIKEAMTVAMGERGEALKDFKELFASVRVSAQTNSSILGRRFNNAFRERIERVVTFAIFKSRFQCGWGLSGLFEPFQAIFDNFFLSGGKVNFKGGVGGLGVWDFKLGGKGGKRWGPKSGDRRAGTVGFLSLLGASSTPRIDMARITKIFVIIVLRIRIIR